MDLLSHALEVLLHLDRHLAHWVAAYGAWIYALLFVIVFCETGLVVTPFLPGDSLLFAAGAIAGSGGLDPLTLSGVLFVAAVAGDGVNYAIGRWAGPRAERWPDSRWWRRAYLARTQAFFARHGGKTIVLARFVPIVRTYAPFVAGVGRMSYRWFAGFNVFGAALWVSLFVGAGYWFGELPAVKENFTLVIFGIIAVSLLPPAFEYLRARRGAA
jgi:membrane-associated protein